MENVNRKAGVVAYACDVGSIQKKNFGWARVTRERRALIVGGGTSIDGCVKALRRDLKAERTVAVGMECPEFIPIPADSERLGRGRQNEKDRSSFAPMGATVLVFGLQQLAFLLKKLGRRRLLPIFDIQAWNYDPRKVLFWEAFVAKQAHSSENDHVRDAATAATAFLERLESRKWTTDVSVEPPSAVFSLVGCVLLWAGWSDDLSLIKEPVLVVKPDKQYQGEIQIL